MRVQKRIMLFAPSGSYEGEKLKKNLMDIKRLLPRQLTVDIHRKPTRRDPPFTYLHDSDRHQQINFLKATRDCDILWCIRGGYGSSRWAGKIRWQEIVNPSFPIVTGFSDITFLHSAITRMGGKSIHGPMPCTIEDTSDKALSSLFSAMTENRFPALSGETISKGRAHGILTGGNLNCLCHTSGTVLEPAWDNAILFLEDCNEALYRIDRMLTWLGSSGILSRVAGVALGAFTGTGADFTMLNDLFRDRLGHYGIPVISGLSAGHIADNMPLLMGGRYLLEAKDNAALLTPAEGA